MKERAEIQTKIHKFSLISIVAFILMLIIPRNDVLGKFYSLFFFSIGLILFILFAINGGFTHKIEIFTNLIRDFQLFWYHVSIFFGKEKSKNNQILEIIKDYENESNGRNAIESMLFDQTNGKIGPYLIKIDGCNEKGFRISSFFDYSY